MPKKNLNPIKTKTFCEATRELLMTDNVKKTDRK